MHAGEALWTIYTKLKQLELKNAAKPAGVKALQPSIEACSVLSQQIQVPLPTPEQVAQRIAIMEGNVPQVEVKEPPRDKYRGVTDPAGKECIDLIETIRDKATDLPDKAEEWKETFLEKIGKTEDYIVSRNKTLDWHKESLEDLLGKIANWIERD